MTFDELTRPSSSTPGAQLSQTEVLLALCRNATMGVGDEPQPPAEITLPQRHLLPEPWGYLADDHSEDITGYMTSDHPDRRTRTALHAAQGHTLDRLTVA